MPQQKKSASGAGKGAAKSRSAKPGATPARSRSTAVKRTATPAAQEADEQAAELAAPNEAALEELAGAVEAEARAGGHEGLRRLLDPLDMVVLTRDRLQQVIDDAVKRGRLTRDDGHNLLGELLTTARRQTEDVLVDLEQLLGRSRESLTGNIERARRAVGAGPSFPIDGYDDLTAAAVIAQLDGLTPAELRKVRDYERRNANRKSVLAAIDQQLGG